MKTRPVGADPGPAWAAIPGARGCTAETCGFRDQYADLQRLQVDVYGVSTQDSRYQQEMAGRLHVPFEVLSDDRLRLAGALRLPTFQFEGARLIERLTLVVRDGTIEKVLHPVAAPDRHAAEIVAWLNGHPVAP